MSRLVVKCPECGHQETVMSSRPDGKLPPCPRCEEFVQMTNVTPTPDQTQQTWSTAGSQSKSDETSQPPTPRPTPKRRDMRDPGPQPRN